MSNVYNFPRGLQLLIRQLGEDAIEFELKNCLYPRQRHHKLKQLFALLTIFGLYILISGLAAPTGLRVFQRSLIADFGFALHFLFLVITTTNLIVKEKLLFCSDFAMQIEVEQFLSRRSNSFVPISSIYDVRINEVIENIDIHYMLIVRTKGQLFKKRPIIPLFNSQKPTLDCLELIYKHINKIRKKQTMSVSVST